MNAIRNLLERMSSATSRFENYYGGVARTGAGYPTADEARRDLIRHDEAVSRYNWVR